MKTDPALIDRIYETAVAIEQWPILLEEIAQREGAVGAIAFSHGPSHMAWVASTRSQQMAQDYMDAEWWRDPYALPLVQDMPPGFKVATDYYTMAEIEAFAVQREFFIPRGLTADASTMIQGAADEMLHFSVFGYPSHPAARQGIATLDPLRPHLARALSLSSQLMAARSQTVVASLALGGLAAAIVARDGRLKAMNALFEARLRDRCDTRRHRLRFADPFLDAQFRQQMTATPSVARLGSIASHAEPGAMPLVIHMLPLCGAAREVADSDGILLIVASGANAGVPGADLLRILFDLTPAEARLTRLLASGTTLAAAAATLRIAVNTARVHLKSAFAKTGVNRQADLQALLCGLGPGQIGHAPAA